MSISFKTEMILSINCSKNGRKEIREGNTITFLLKNGTEFSGIINDIFEDSINLIIAGDKKEVLQSLEDLLDRIETIYFKDIDSYF